jgi:hypothetical protein
VGQSFGFASELPLGPELAILPMNRREYPQNRVGRKTWAFSPALAELEALEDEHE